MIQVDKCTALGRNAIGSAQSAALSANHQKLMAEHILMALLKDNNMTVKMLLTKAGGDSAALSAHLKTAIDKFPQVTGGGAGQLQLDTDLAKIFRPWRKKQRLEMINISLLICWFLRWLNRVIRRQAFKSSRF